MNVLILSGRFGFGHNSVAEALRGDIRKINDDINIEVVDLIEYLYPEVSELVYKTFDTVVKRYHDIFNIFYKLTEELEIDMKIKGSKVIRKIEKLLEVNKPDLIISTLPICAQTMSQYKSKTSITIPLVTCVTDLSLHTEWIAPNTDYYLVPSIEIKDILVERGLKEKNIYVVGVPVRQDFRREVTKELTGRAKNVLIMGGGLGLLPNMDKMLKDLNILTAVKKTIITGRNQKAFKKFTNAKYTNTEVIGYTDKIFDYMVESDLIITKAGGVTLFEAIHTETPLFVITPFLEQEKLNAEFIERENIGRVIWDEDTSNDELIELIFNADELKIMRDNIKRVKNEFIIDDIDKSLEKMLKGYDSKDELEIK